jgi:DNA-binding MarR family transcriptional regulator
MAVSDRVKQQFRTPAEAAFVGLLVAAAHVEQQLEAACAEHGITHAQYNVLRILRGAHPEGHPRFEIAERLMARAPDVTRLLDRLERQELVERGWAKHNRRHSIARITRKGLDLLRRVDPRVAQIRESALSRLSDEQLRQLARAFDTMVP